MIDPRYELDIAQMKRRGEFLRWFLIVGNIVCVLLLASVPLFKHGMPLSARLSFIGLAAVCGAFAMSAYLAGRSKR